MCKCLEIFLSIWGAISWIVQSLQSTRLPNTAAVAKPSQRLRNLRWETGLITENTLRTPIYVV